MVLSVFNICRFVTLSSLLSFLFYLPLLLHASVSWSASSDRGHLLIYVGAASKPPAEEAASVFEKKTGVRVDLNIGGSGTLLSQMELTQKGDVYFPGSSDYMELAKRKGIVIPETEAKVVYLVPAINVRRGNPKNIKNLRDMTRPGLRVAIGNPENVCVGAYAVEVIEKVFSAEEKVAFRKNLVNYTDSCEKTANAIALKTVDAVIGWSVFEHWNPERIQTIPMERDEVVRVGYIPVAISRYTNNRPLAQKFIDFLLSPEGKAIFKKHNYFMTPDEAFNWLGDKKPVGGEYAVPNEWLGK